MRPSIQLSESDRLNPELTKEEKMIPCSILQEHCDEYTSSEDLSHLRTLFEIGLVNEQYNNPEKRMALLVWYKDMAKVLEVFHILSNRGQWVRLES